MILRVKKILASLLTLALLLSTPGPAFYATAGDILGNGGNPNSQEGPKVPQIPPLAAPLTPPSPVPGSPDQPPAAPRDIPPVPVQPPQVLPVPPISPQLPAAPAPPAKAQPAWLGSLGRLAQGVSKAIGFKGVEAGKAGVGVGFDGSQSVDAVDVPLQDNIQRYIHENFSGWRTVHGQGYGTQKQRIFGLSQLLPLKPTMDQIVTLLSMQLQNEISRDELLKMAKEKGLTANKPLKDWLYFYDTLHRAQQGGHHEVNRIKYESRFTSQLVPTIYVRGWLGYFVNKDYAPGWRGRVQRALQLHVHAAGILFRVPQYVLSFVFGEAYQNISYEFFHSTENFLEWKHPDRSQQRSLDTRSETVKIVEKALSAYAFAAKEGKVSAWEAHPLKRFYNRWIRTTLVDPIIHFSTQRLFSVLMTVVGTGVLAAFAPHLFLALPLMAIPGLGPLLAGVLHGVLFVGGIPVIGPAVVMAADALTHALVVGRILSILLISVPRGLSEAFSAKLAEVKRDNPSATNPYGEAVKLTFSRQTLSSWRFWKPQLKSFFSMLVIGAEFQAFFAYAGGADSIVRFFGWRSFHFFSAVADAVDGQGGVYSWGNILLDKFQNLLRFNLTDGTMHFMVKVFLPHNAQNAALAHASAQAVFAEATDAGSSDWKFDPTLSLQPEAAAAARLQALSAHPGDLRHEMDAVRAHVDKLNADLTALDARLVQLHDEERPITAADSRDRLLAAFDKNFSADYRESKAAQVHDLRHPEAMTRLQKLKDIDDYYHARLGPPPGGPNGYADSMSFYQAQLKSLARHLTDPAKDAPQAAAATPAQKAAVERISGLVKGLGDVAGQVRAELANRDAAKGMMVAVEKARTQAKTQAGNGQSMFDFYKNLGRVDAMQSFLFAWRTIMSGEAAIDRLTAITKAKVAAIQASQASNAQNAAINQAMANNQPVWTTAQQQAIASDKSTQSNIFFYQNEANSALNAFTAFQQQIGGLRGTVNSAFADSAKNLDLLNRSKDNAQSRMTHGDPNNPSAFSLQMFLDILNGYTDSSKVHHSGINDYIALANQGISLLPTIPDEAALIAVWKVPDPFALTQDQVTQQGFAKILDDRQAYWSDMQTTYQGYLTTVSQMLSDDPALAPMVDVFGNTHPTSLSQWKKQMSGQLAGSQSLTKQYLNALDAAAAQINKAAAPGSQLPMLSALSLDQLETALTPYVQKLENVQFQANIDPGVAFQAKLGLAAAAQTFPYAAYNLILWGQAQATIPQIDQAVGVLQSVQPKFQDIMGMFTEIFNDIQADRVFIAESKPNNGDQQKLLTRKENLLRDLLRYLTEAQTLLGSKNKANSLIGYMQQSVNQLKPNDQSGPYYQLYYYQNYLQTSLNSLYSQTMPWAMITYGAKTPNDFAKLTSQDTQAGLASIDSFSGTLSDYLSNPQTGVKYYQQLVDRRAGKNGYNGTEQDNVTNGAVPYTYDAFYSKEGGGPYALPAKVVKYTKERQQRAKELTDSAVTLNQILDELQTLSGQGFIRFPVSVNPDDANSVAAVNALQQPLLDLKTQLVTLGNSANDVAGAPSISLAGGTSIPVGTKDTLTFTNNQQKIAFLALQAGEYLVPSSITGARYAYSHPGVVAPKTAYALSMARLLYSDAIISSSNDALHNQIPVADQKLAEISQALSAAINDAAANRAIVAKNFQNVDPEAAYQRELGIYTQLSTALGDVGNFFNQKLTWDKASLETIQQVGTYYATMASSVYGTNNQTLGPTGGLAVNAAELQACNELLSTMGQARVQLEDYRRQLEGYIQKIGKQPVHDLGQSFGKLLDDVQRVLEASVGANKISGQAQRSETILKTLIAQAQDQQTVLKRELDQLKNDGGTLPPELLSRIEALHLGRNAWAMTTDKGQSVIVKKSEFKNFVESILGMLQSSNPSLSIEALKTDILKDPRALTGFIKDSSMLDTGGSDGFYIYYKTDLGFSHGLESSNLVSLENIAEAFSDSPFATSFGVSAHQFSDMGASDGDRGVDMQLSSTKGEHWVNYFNSGFHHSLVNVPAGVTTIDQIRADRVLIMDRFAFVLLDDRLFVCLGGFRDFAAQQAGENPVYSGGEVKTTLKMTEIATLGYEQRYIFIHDPRKFLEQVDFSTGFDPSLDLKDTIASQAPNSRDSFKKGGVTLDLRKLMNAQDDLTMELYFAQTTDTEGDPGLPGTQGLSQKSAGVKILKGYSIRNSENKEVVRITDKVGEDLGQRYNTVSNQLSVQLPDSGVVISADGQIMGTGKQYYGKTYDVGVSQSIGSKTNIKLGISAPYVGAPARPFVSFTSQFSLQNLLDGVRGRASEALKGAQSTQALQEGVEKFFREDRSPQAAAVKGAIAADIGQQLIKQDMGTLTQGILVGRDAGSFFNNANSKAMVGFVTNAVSRSFTDRAASPASAASYTEGVMNRTQKAFLQAKAAGLAREGLRLQMRLADIVKDWEAAVIAVAQAQWELKIAAGAAATPEEAATRLVQAQARYNQALLNYNQVAGRDLSAPFPFGDLSAGGLKSLFSETEKLLAAPDRFSQILRSLDKKELEGLLNSKRWHGWGSLDRPLAGDAPVNIMDLADFHDATRWETLNTIIDGIAGVDQFSLGIGLQLPDMMSQQMVNGGGRVQKPLWNPAAQPRDQAYRAEALASQDEMLQALSEWRLKAAHEAQAAQVLGQKAGGLDAGLKASAADLGSSAAAYRNGYSSPSRLRAAYDSWHWYESQVLEARGSAILSRFWSSADSRLLAGKEPSTIAGDDPLQLTNLQGLAMKSHSLDELANRQKAAAQMIRVDDRRLQKVSLGVSAGLNFTAVGLGLIPVLSITGIPVTPSLDFEIKPSEMRALQRQEHKGEEDYYQSLQDELEGDLAVRFTQSVVSYKTAEKTAKAVDEARAGLQGLELDKALARMKDAELQMSQAQATMNHLLGRDPNAPLDLSALDADQAVKDLEQRMASRNLAQSQRAVLAQRVQIARAIEARLRQGEDIDHLRLDPLSFLACSIGQLIHTIGGPSATQSERAQAAFFQLLTEVQAQSAYEQSVAAQTSRLGMEMRSLQAQLQTLPEKTDLEHRLKRAELEGAIGADRIALSSLGQSAPAAASAQDFPTNFVELKDRLAKTARAASAQAPGSAVDPIPAQLQEHDAAAGYMRYFYANSGLNPNDKIYQGFADGWLELRWQRAQLDDRAASKLIQLRQERHDHVRENVQAGAAAHAELLAEQFAFKTRLWRSLQGRRELEPVADKLRLELKEQSIQMAALLGSDPGLKPEDKPEAVQEKLNELCDRLMALVASDPSARGLAGMTEDFLGQVRARQLDHVRRTLFGDGMPDVLGHADSLMGQLRADVISEQMSYKGFTPGLAFGVFHGQKVGAAFLEAPDPQAIEGALTKILSDSLRQELQSQGRIKELSVHLAQLMNQVSDGTKGIEAQGKLIEMLEKEYRNRSALAHDKAEMKEASAVLDRLLSAYQEMNRLVTDTKGAFIVLTGEIDALNLADDRLPAMSPLSTDAPKFGEDPTAELLVYGTERMLDEGFARRFDEQLVEFGPGLTAEGREKIQAGARAYRRAVAQSQELSRSDLSADQKMRRAIAIDKEGHRQKLQADLAGLWDAMRQLPGADRSWKGFLGFMQDDIAREERRAEGARTERFETATLMRDAYWHAVAAPADVEAAFKRLEGLRRHLADARQALAESRQAELSLDPVRFLSQNAALDEYLKAEAAFDNALIETFDLPQVRADDDLARSLNILYDLRRTLGRTGDAWRFGRGLRAVNGLISVEEARLLALRWDGAPRQQIDAAAVSLQDLRAMRARWLDGKVSPAEEAALRVSGGVDAAEAARAQSTILSQWKENGLVLQNGLRSQEFIVADQPDKTYTYAQLFGPGGLQEKGKLLFFEKKVPLDNLHKAMHPWAALPQLAQSVMYVYLGDKDSLPQGLYPTLESALEQPGAFGRVIMSAQGAVELKKDADKLSLDRQRMGWILVKRDFGFARDGQGRMAAVFMTQNDFDARIQSFQHASHDVAADEKAQEKVGVKPSGHESASPQLKDRIRPDIEKANVRHASESKTDYENRIDGLRDRIAARLAPLQRAADDKKTAMDDASLEYTKAQTEIQSKLEAQIQDDPNGESRFFRENQRAANETDADYAKRLTILTKDFKKAQKIYESFTKASSAAAAKFKQALDDFQTKEMALKQANGVLTQSQTWSLYKSDALSLSLDKQGFPLKALASPSYGSMPLDEKIGDGVVDKDHSLSGPLYAATIDDQTGRVRHAWTSRKEVSKDAKDWSLVSVGLDGEAAKLASDAKTVQPTFHLDHYETAEHFPVMLNARYLAETLQDAQSNLGAIKRQEAPYMPQNWVRVAISPVNGILSEFNEAIFGIDPKHNGYLGLASASQLEGGVVPYSYVRRFGHAIDFLDLAPYRVEGVYDRSQLPKVQVGSVPGPGKTFLDQTMLIPASSERFLPGKAMAQRVIQQSMENMLNESERTLSYFQSGVEDVSVASKLGRDGIYEDSRKEIIHFPQGLHQALYDSFDTNEKLQSVRRAVGDRPDRLAKVSASLDNLELKEFKRQVRIFDGAEQYAAQAQAAKDYSPEEYSLSLQAQSAQVASQLAENQAHESVATAQARRVGAHEALERVSHKDGFVRLKLTDSRERKEIRWWQDYLKRLADPGSEGRHQPLSREWALIWLAASMLLSAALWWLLQLLGWVKGPVRAGP